MPTAAMRSGDFSAFLGNQIGVDAVGNPIRQGQIYDPLTTRTVNGQKVRTAFPGNIIPANRFSSVAIKLLTYYPSPTNAAAASNLSNVTATGTNTNRYDIRIDENISTRHRLFGRYSEYRSAPLVAVPFRGASGDFSSNAGLQRSLSLSFITTLSSNAFNEVRGSSFRQNQTRFLI